MGHFSIVHGYIDALGDYADENRASIAALPEDDGWPYLTHDMFAVPSREHSYWDQVIPFGTIYNGVERAWDGWLSKFEALLRTMYWYEAHAFLQTELWGSYHYTWKSLSSIPLADRGSTPPVQEWEFSGGPRTDLRKSYADPGTSNSL